ncbi:molybdenum cofactor guanylyltransferase MobA [Ottowia sp.]|uniref:molybdenum cofactor guanylyltransferase MobA n=1 Tax=Ottowia sp. TaxID=1898956 RepID=UPI003A867455
MLINSTPTLSLISALVLAGGRGSRMGGADKGLQVFGGDTLAQNALARLRAQTLPPAEVLISANRHLDIYARFGVRVVGDAVPDFAGPLAGFLAGLQACQTPLLLTVPCDVPRFPLSLCERLAKAMQAQEVDIAMISAPDDDGTGTLRPQPVFCLLRVALQDSLKRYMDSGQRQIAAWAAQQQQVLVPFNTPDDDPRAFANANTLSELRALDTL